MTRLIIWNKLLKMARVFISPPKSFFSLFRYSMSTLRYSPTQRKNCCIPFEYSMRVCKRITWNPFKRTKYKNPRTFSIYWKNTQKSIKFKTSKSLKDWLGKISKWFPKCLRRFSKCSNLKQAYRNKTWWFLITFSTSLTSLFQFGNLVTTKTSYLTNLTLSFLPCTWRWLTIILGSIYGATMQILHFDKSKEKTHIP